MTPVAWEAGDSSRHGPLITFAAEPAGVQENVVVSEHGAEDDLRHPTAEGHIRGGKVEDRPDDEGHGIVLRVLITPWPR